MFHTTWEHVRDSVRHAVAWGLVHRDLSGVEAIGVDEIQWRRGHHYLTLVYQIDAGCKRLLWIGRERTEDSLRRGLELLGAGFLLGLAVRVQRPVAALPQGAGRTSRREQSTCSIASTS